ncbi:hypothetical protein JJE66_37095 [Bradyrhizobium diazoefficiens]|uniref:hypothetical protein n=1 Tax=Bradyrhizobium diazoefficiens TaxID=1355477 RepID=UPI00190CC2A3|nr:hypothetical protein [Bradyrhizobium diazoefficiens]MBK3666812.1 hypothetical protein [Bradyrhizobium diazoefficiens]
MAAVLERLAALDLGEKERTGQHVRCRRQKRRQATSPLHDWVQIDQRMAQASTAGRRPLVTGPRARIEGGPQRIAPDRRDSTAEQEIPVARQRGG